MYFTCHCLEDYLVKIRNTISGRSVTIMVWIMLIGINYRNTYIEHITNMIQVKFKRIFCLKYDTNSHFILNGYLFCDNYETNINMVYS